jgi:GDP-4-dehydro-6-deoxy-D-mannose reductase
MRVLITGATGFAGRHLAEHAAGAGATTTGLGRHPLEADDRPAGTADHLVANLLDAREAEDAVRATAPDRVFHLAAEASVARSWEDPAGTVARNLSATVHVLEAVRRHAPEARVLVAGSGEEYGVPDRLPVDEHHPLRPRNPYAVGKAAAELAAGFYADSHGLHVVRTRSFNHAGPRQTTTYVVASLARQVAAAEAGGSDEGAEIVTGNTEVRRDFTDVRDVVRAYWQALEDAGPGVYNVCSGRSVAVSEILRTLVEEARTAVTSRVDPALLRENDVMEIVGSHARLTDATGWEPEIPLEQTLRDTLDWFRSRLQVETAGRNHGRADD